VWLPYGVYSLNLHERVGSRYAAFAEELPPLDISPVKILPASSYSLEHFTQVLPKNNQSSNPDYETRKAATIAVRVDLTLSVGVYYGAFFHTRPFLSSTLE